MSDIQHQGNGKGDDFLIVNRSSAGYRVYPASRPSNQHLVSSDPTDPACTCDSYAEDHNCEHVRAVLEQISEPERVEFAERCAIESEGTTTANKKTASSKKRAAATMTLKRSVSPDGRIDSLSVEFSCPVGDVSNHEIASRATKILGLQTEIASGFLKRRNNKQNGNGNGKSAAKTTPNGAIGAKMLYVGTYNGRYGPRLFIAFQANGQNIKLFGTAKELAHAVSGAGYEYGDRDIAEGVYLNLPCRVITKPSRDGRYTDIEQVLPDGEQRKEVRHD